MTATNFEERVEAAEGETAYWNANIPHDQWTLECPEYLAGVDAFDREQLGRKDSDYQLMSWQEVSSIVTENRLESFKRVPSDLRRYRKYINEIKAKYGSVMSFILQERVKWSEIVPKGEPFQHSDDIKVLVNDWPYGVDQKITHLVVWTKFSFAEDPATGDLTPETRKQIDDFVNMVFVKNMTKDRVLWFKNWAALKSVQAVEHFHVMLFDPDPQFVDKITQEDLML